MHTLFSLSLSAWTKEKEEDLRPESAKGKLVCLGMDFKATLALGKPAEECS